mmetsp:Transcript_2425/g.2374  ORF Transcript_2425/g.2374 Transcript_2425/m.2374 type:complete len:168 (+) Transcript_2425:27-530(+)
MLCKICGELFLSDQAVNFIEQGLANNQCEKKIQINERELGLNRVNFLVFRDAVKRYGYKNVPFTHKVLTYIGPKIGIKAEDFDQEEGEDAMKEICRTFKNDYIFHEGSYNVRRLIILGFMHCKHSTPYEQREEMWCLINPEAKPTVTKLDVMEFFRIVFHLAITLRL